MPYRVIEVLKVGRYRLPDGRTFESTAERNRRVCEQANRQLAVGIRQPAAWMHDPDADPVYLSGGVNPHKDAWLAKGYFGEAHKFTTDAAGNVWAKVWIHDEADARQFDKVRQVSPGLYPGWVDEKNVRWPEMTILHIAATPKPIQRDIGSGEPPLFLSQAAVKPGTILLSFPATTRSVPMADELEATEVETEGGASLSPEHIGKIVEMLKKHGLMLADGIANADDLLLALESASKTMTGDGGEPDAENMGGPSDGDSDNLEDEAPPVMMSHLAKRVAQFEVKEKNDRLTAALKAGKITKPHFEKLSKQLNGINLSQPVKALFNADGSFKRTELDVVLDTIDQLPAGPLVGRHVHLSHQVQEAAKPDEAATKTEEQLREERLKEIRATPAVKQSKRSK
jgi:hypothetical protein